MINYYFFDKSQLKFKKFENYLFENIDENHLTNFMSESNSSKMEQTTQK
jgi:hypothetical protein